MGPRQQAIKLLLTVPFLLFGCDNDPYCPEGLSWCWAQCVDLMNDENNCGACDNSCDSDWDCVDGVCKDPCEWVICNTHYCPATGTFECAWGPVSEFQCTCPVDGGCEPGEYITNCTYPESCACVGGECVEEVDCPYGFVCPGEDKSSCACATEPLSCPAANRSCDDVIEDMLEFHEENSSCVDDWDCTTVHSGFYLVPNVCCYIYLSVYANEGIWHILESQLSRAVEPGCDRIEAINCCDGPIPPGRCIDGKCGP